jgi:hypothetical protein
VFKNTFLRRIHGPKGNEGQHKAENVIFFSSSVIIKGVWDGPLRARGSLEVPTKFGRETRKEGPFEHNVS